VGRQRLSQPGDRGKVQPARPEEPDSSQGLSRNREFSETQKAANKTRSKVRARVKHVFGDQKNSMGAEIMRTIGIVRARCKIGMTNLVYNMRHFVFLERMAEAAW
jgi:hypothetical protein